MKKTLTLSMSLLGLFVVAGCGQRVAGNPSNFNYEQYSNYHDYSKKQLEEKEQQVKEINPQSVIQNKPIPGESTVDFNKAHRHISKK